MPRHFEYRGQSYTASALARMKNLPVATLLSRIDVLGWPVEKAADTPITAKFRRGGRRAKNTVRPCPRLEHHKPSGKGRCRWYEGGRRREKWFGEWGSSRCREEYARFAAEWIADQGRPVHALGEKLTVADLCDYFLDWAKSPAGYCKNGKPTSEVYAYSSTCKTWVALYGTMRVADFKPSGLRAVRSKWIESGAARDVANRYAGKLVKVIAWGVARELVPAATLAPLREVERLKAGQTAARDPAPVVSADPAAVSCVLPHLHADPARRAVLAAMIEVQRHSGMRPGELVTLRAGMIDRTREPWVCDLSNDGANKNLHKGKGRVIYFGPRSRGVLAPLLKVVTKPDEFVFRFKRERKVRLGTRPLSRHEYGRLVALACKRAGVAEWTPNQLRHLRATEIMDVYESSADAAKVLGNSPEVLSRVYADDPGGAAARRIAEETG